MGGESGKDGVSAALSGIKIMNTYPKMPNKIVPRYFMLSVIGSCLERDEDEWLV